VSMGGSRSASAKSLRFETAFQQLGLGLVALRLRLVMRHAGASLSRLPIAAVAAASS
jgi:hypothetical protein